MLYSLYLLLLSGIGTIWQRVFDAFSTVPTWSDCLLAAALLGLYALIALPIGFQTKFIQRQGTGLSRFHFLGALIACFLSPGITEELVFRVFLLPHPREASSWTTQAWMSLLSLILFILYHPLNAYTAFPAGRKVFVHPVFLLLATLLGVVCTVVYLASGSFWLPVVVHWLIVVVWLLFLGGYGKLYAEKTTHR